MVGKLEHQKFFENLFDLAIQGMNLGGMADEVEHSGEFLILMYLKSQYQNTMPIIF